MKNNLIFFFLIVIVSTLLSCKNEVSKLDNAEKAILIDSAKVVVQKVFDASNDLKFVDGLNYYSDSPDVRFTSNGTIYPSLAALRKDYEQIGSFVEVLENKIERWDAQVISENAVSFTLPINLKIKLKGLPTYNGHLVWTGILKKKQKKWQVIQSHESWLNCAEALAALSGIDEK